MKSANNYINEAIKNPKYICLINGKEVKRYAFYRQALQFAIRHNAPNLFFEEKCNVINAETGEQII